MTSPVAKQWLAILLITLILILFSVLSYSAALTKNATVDEPLHLLSGFIHRTKGDFRIDPEQPALFGYFATLPLSSRALQPDYTSPKWAAIRDDHGFYQWDFATETLYPPGVNRDDLIQRSRLMFTVVAVALGAAIALWSWHASGALAAVIAVLFFALDPNFLAHGSLIKNDVPVSAMFLLVAYGLWRFGQRASYGSLIVLASATAIAINVKYSGLIFGPIIFAVLVIRAFLPRPWVLHRWTIRSLWQKLAIASVACLIVALTSYLSVWATYQWRFLPTRDSDLLLNSPRVVEMIKQSRAGINHDPDHAASIGFLPALIVRAESWRLLPQAWLFGLLYTFNTTLHAPAYLLGNYSQTGWWYYFPLAMLFKTPSATLLAMGIALVYAAVTRTRAFNVDEDANPDQRWAGRWVAICLLVPFGIYSVAALSANINIGFRYILPIYPFIYIGLGIALSALVRRWPHAGHAVVLVLVIGLFTETLLAFPNYISFFNTPSRSAAANLKLLGDSNVDWGQDLKNLAAWQQQHADRPLYLCYFGGVDPAAYGIQAQYLPGGWPYNAKGQTAARGRQNRFLAISATHLLGIHYTQESRQMYKALLDYKPAAILGGSIYIYNLPLTPADRKIPATKG